MRASDWTSLLPQISLADRLYGSRGAVMFNEWLDLQNARISDPEFARLFSSYVSLSGIMSGDYNHRLIRFHNKSLLGGIRFYGQDASMPFVDVIAHDFDDWNALRGCIASEWESFKPYRFRVLIVPETPVPETAYIDMSVHAAPYAEIAPPDGRVSLRRFDNAEDAVALVTNRYANLEQTDPDLANNLSPAEPDDIRDWHRNHQLKAIHARTEGSDEIAGLLAIAPGAIEWVEGDEVNEEVVLSAYNGGGLAASAQCAWAARADFDPQRLLVGTIDRLNAASRRTAINVGRKAILNYVFIPT